MTFAVSPHGDNYHRIQHADAGGNGTHIICTADELAQLRELLAPTAWSDKPSVEGKYVYMPLPHLPYIVEFANVFEHAGELLVERTSGVTESLEYRRGLWLKLPEAPKQNAV